MVTPYVIVLRLAIPVESGVSLYSGVTYSRLYFCGLALKGIFVPEARPAVILTSIIPISNG